MTEKEAYQRLKILQQQLTLLNLYPKNFEKYLGHRGIEEWVDEVLDEMNELYKIIETYEKHHKSK